MNWDSELNKIRGKNLVGKASKTDVSLLFRYLDILETHLEESDYEDTFGTEGWRRFFGVQDN